MLAILPFVLLSAQISKAENNYCSFSYQESIQSSSSISDSNSNYFYFDVEGYSKDSFSNLKNKKSETFSIQGDFGTLLKVSNSGSESSYTAYSLSFHIPPEHFYDKKADLEIMVHHRDSSDNYLALCYLFSNSTGEENSSRRFFSSLSDAIDGTSNIDPTDLSGGFYHIKEFYYRSSTAHSIACNSYDWAVYSNVIKISTSHLDDIKKYLVTVRSQGRSDVDSSYTTYTGSQVEFAFTLVAGLAYLLV